MSALPSSPVRSNNRLHHFDLVRLSLVLLVLAYHFLITQQADVLSQGGIWLYIKAILRSTMPVLLIVFGFMIEYVYASRWVTKGPRIVGQRMLYRAVVCYLAFVSILVLVALQNQNSLTKLIGSSLFVYAGHSHANLFKYYAILIPITFGLLWFRFRYGWLGKVFLILLLVASVELLQLHIGALPSPVGYMGGLFMGLGEKVGPSMIHSLVLILFGMLTASCVTRPAIFQLAALFTLSALSVAALLIELNRIGLHSLLTQITTYSAYRAHNSHIYFAYGIVMFLVYWFIAKVLVMALGEKTKENISYYGGNTLSIFYYGNVLILITPVLDKHIMPLAFVAILILTLLASMFSVNALDWADRSFGVLKKFSAVINSFNDRILNILKIAPASPPEIKANLYLDGKTELSETPVLTNLEMLGPSQPEQLLETYPKDE